MSIIGGIIAGAVAVGTVIAVVEIVNRVEDPERNIHVVEEDRKKTLKEKFRDFKEKEQHKLDVFFNWIKNHPYEAMAVATLTLGAVTESRRIADRVNDSYLRKQQRLSVWCGDVQSYVKLKHELSYKENRELRERMSDGETKFQALDAMGLLK